MGNIVYGEKVVNDTVMLVNNIIVFIHLPLKLVKIVYISRWLHSINLASILTLGAHAPAGLQYLGCVSVTLLPR